jgi:hypothetical protein
MTPLLVTAGCKRSMHTYSQPLGDCCFWARYTYSQKRTLSGELLAHQTQVYIHTKRICGDCWLPHHISADGAFM